MKHTEWLDGLTNGESVNAIARKAGLVARTFARQVDRNRFDAESVIKLAVAYDVHPVRALVDTGYLDERYARTVDPASAIRTVTEDQLADEVLRRMKLGVATAALTTDVNELEARRRSNTPTPHVAPLDDDEMPESAVAYSGPDEDQLRQEDDVD